MLLVALLAVAVMTIQGAIAGTGFLNHRTQQARLEAAQSAALAAEAGVYEALARLAAPPTTTGHLRDPALSPDPNWSAYILTSPAWQFSEDPEYRSTAKNYVPTLASLTSTTITRNSLQSRLSYWVKLRYKREYDAEQDGHTTTFPHYDDRDTSLISHNASDPGSVVHHGYPWHGMLTPTDYATTSTTNLRPVVLIQAYGRSGTIVKGYEVEVSPQPGPPAAIYSKGNVAFVSGASGIVNGNDDCGMSTNRATIYNHGGAAVTGGVSLSGNPSAPQQGSGDIDLARLIQRMKAGGTVLTTDQQGVTYGSTSNYVTVYSNTAAPLNIGGLSLSNVTGYGLLLVEGDLVLKGPIVWRGAIYTTGTIVFDGNPGEITVTGAIYTGGGLAVLKANPIIKFNSCVVRPAMTGKPWRILRWREL